MVESAREAWAAATDRRLVVGIRATDRFWILQPFIVLEDTHSGKDRGDISQAGFHGEFFSHRWPPTD